MLNSNNPKYIEIINAIDFFNRNKISITTCAKKFNIHRTTLAKYLKEFGLHQDRRAYFFNENFFEIIDTEEKAYWLGFIVADGCLKSNKNVFKLRQSKKDICHLEKFKKSINSEHPISIEIVSLKNKSYEVVNIVINNKKLYNDLLDKKIYPNKSRNETFSDIPNKLLNHYIRGLYDGDGWLSWNNKSFELGIGMGEDILILLKNMIEKEVKIKSYNIKPYKSIFRYRISSKKEGLKVLDYIYKDATIYLDRKYQNYLNCRLESKSQKAQDY